MPSCVHGGQRIVLKPTGALESRCTRFTKQTQGRDLYDGDLDSRLLELVHYQACDLAFLFHSQKVGIRIQPTAVS